MDALLLELAAEGLLDDRRAATQRARRWAERGYGRARAEQDLQARGFAEDAIEFALNEWFADEWSNAQRVLSRKFPALARRETRVQAARFLLRRGFAEDVVVALLGDSC